MNGRQQATRIAARLSDGGVPVRHLYVHLPFCQRICPYCDFSTAVGAGGDIDGFLRALREEAGLLKSAGLLDALTLQDGTLFLGGGTPSWFSEEVLAQLLGWLGDLAPGPWREATVEVNPEHADTRRLGALREGGITRLSLGAQSMTPETLRLLGRTHTADDARRAVAGIRSIGLAVSLDLIFAVPDQTMTSWLRDLDAALALEPDHISLYNLTYESGTPFYRWRSSGRIRALSQEWEAEAYQAAVDRVAREGYERYEVSNFARPGQESVHNRAYWSGASYLGLGPSAHSLLGDVRTAAHFDLDSWQAAVGRGEVPWEDSEVLDSLAVARERVLLGLRTRPGVLLADVPEAHRETIRENARRAVAGGYALWTTGSTLCLTDRGMLIADELAAAIAP